MSLHIPIHHRPLYFTLTMPVRWLEFSQAPQVSARTLKGRSLPSDIWYLGQRKLLRKIFSMSLPHSKLSSTIIFYADNAGTIAKFFKGSPGRHKNTRGPVISRGGWQTKAARLSLRYHAEYDEVSEVANSETSSYSAWISPGMNRR